MLTPGAPAPALTDDVGTDPFRVPGLSLAVAAAETEDDASRASDGDDSAGVGLDAAACETVVYVVKVDVVKSVETRVWVTTLGGEGEGDGSSLRTPGLLLDPPFVLLMSESKGKQETRGGRVKAKVKTRTDVKRGWKSIESKITARARRDHREGDGEFES